LLTRLFHRFEFIDLSLESIGVAASQLLIPASQLLCLALLQALLLVLFPLRGRRVDGPFLILGHLDGLSARPIGMIVFVGIVGAGMEVRFPRVVKFRIRSAGEMMSTALVKSN
jgi:hypothetical protein